MVSLNQHPRTHLNCSSKLWLCREPCLLWTSAVSLFLSIICVNFHLLKFCLVTVCHALLFCPCAAGCHAAGCTSRVIESACVMASVTQASPLLASRHGRSSRWKWAHSRTSGWRRSWPFLPRFPLPGVKAKNYTNKIFPTHKCHTTSIYRSIYNGWVMLSEKRRCPLII